jgi:hypothetical protein
MEQRDNLDHLLDSALTSLNDAVPRDGLEQRILANLAARKSTAQVGAGPGLRSLRWPRSYYLRH